MVDAVVSFVVDRLGDLLIEQFMQKKNKMLIIGCMRKWISNIRNVAYEAKDIIDNFILKVEEGTPKKMGLKDCFEKYFCICSKHSSLIQQANLCRLGREIKTLKTKLTQIQQNQDADKLMPELAKEVKDRYVISIVGTGGLGKTTIARKLYNTLSLIEIFHCYAWVFVSTYYKIQDLLRSIIKSFKRPTTKEELEFLEKMKEEDLEPHLRETLKGRRYLVVLDDEKESWELFCSKSFPNYDEVGNRKNGCPPRLEGLAREMASRCRGLPLAIVVLGGLLQKKDPDEWPKLKEHMWRHLMDHDSHRVQHILALSFNDLPHHLKSCFLYLGLFPKDFEIDAKKVYRLWVTEGFIKQGKESCEEEIEAYLRELIDRSLRLLRVLDLEHHPSNFFQQKENKRLPDEIGKLIHLSYAIQLPDEICKAKQLRHLIGRFKWPFRVDNLTNLRTLTGVFVKEQMEFNPMDLIYLRELQVQYVGKGINKFTLDSIGGLRSLQSLDIDVSTEDTTRIPEVHLHLLSRCQHLLQLRLGDWSLVDWKLPTEVLPNLKYLCLQASGLAEDPMPLLEKLIPKLTVLFLDSYLGKKLVCTAGGFPQLKILQLTN
ncbi:hypothetical protein C3L33_17699, partial [Rhododendron williamsianum]